MTPMWLLPAKKAAPLYERAMRQIRELERLAKAAGWKIRPRKQ